MIVEGMVEQVIDLDLLSTLHEIITSNIPEIPENDNIY
jgi:hypothetical protein